MVEFSSRDISTVDIEESALIDYIKTNYSPDDIFPDDELEDWAERNGYVKND